MAEGAGCGCEFFKEVQFVPPEALPVMLSGSILCSRDGQLVAHRVHLNLALEFGGYVKLPYTKSEHWTHKVSTGSSSPVSQVEVFQFTYYLAF